MPIGWDIGGVNTKVARIESGTVLHARSHPYEIQRDPLALAPLLRSLANAAGAPADDHHAVTMTAELSQLFALLAVRQQLRLDYRGLVALLAEWAELRRALGLRKVPHHSTLCYAAHRLLAGAEKRGSFPRPSA